MPRLATDLDLALSEEAKAFALAQGEDSGVEVCGLVIHRKGPVGDNRRTDSGSTEWQIKRPDHPWRIEVKGFPKYRSDPAFTKEANGIPIQLLFIPKDGEDKLTITLREGELHVQASSA